MGFGNFLLTTGNPFKRPHTDWVVSPLHHVLVWLWFGGLGAFSAFTVLSFLTRPFAETVALTPMADALPNGMLELNITTRCEPIYACGFITVTQKFLEADSPCHNGVKEKLNSSEVFTSFPARSVCPLPLDNEIGPDWSGEGLRVDFSMVSWRANRSEVIVESGDFRYTMALESWQRKTLVVGIIKNIDETVDGGVPSIEISPYFQNLQYDGKHETRWATARVELPQFATVIEKSRPGTWYGVLGEIGGFSGLIFTALKLISMIFPGEVVEKQERKRRRRGVASDRDGEAMSSSHHRRARHSRPISPR